MQKVIQASDLSVCPEIPVCSSSFVSRGQQLEDQSCALRMAQGKVGKNPVLAAVVGSIRTSPEPPTSGLPAVRYKYADSFTKGMGVWVIT